MGPGGALEDRRPRGVTGELVCPHDAEPIIEVTVVRADKEAKVIANKSRTIDPPASEHYAIAAIRVRPVAIIRRRASVLFVHPILGPFPRIAQHVV